MKTMRSKFRGICRGCSEPIVPGTIIRWERGMGACHIGCQFPCEVIDTFDEPDEDPVASRERAEYEAGRAAGERYRAEKAMFGAALAEQWRAQDEWNDYNNGLVD